ncbi:MAG: hypothetical protein Q8J78_03330 [Moraxellaceae bacterium]|nr:hypothetical protein [Moraxellaceae bacterium]
MKRLNVLLSAVLLTLLAACGDDYRADVATTSMDVTPSLGKVQGAVVRVLSLQGAVLGQGVVGSSGSVAVNLPANQVGFIIELQGVPEARYFDEGMGQFRPLPAGRSLHAVSVGPRAQVTVTAFTEIIYQRARALAGTGALTPAVITQAETELAAIFSPAAGSSYLDVPVMVDDPTDLPDDDSWAGAYANQLAGLAQHAFWQGAQEQPDCVAGPTCSALLDLIDAVAADFSDGALDGLRAGTTIGSALYPGSSHRRVPLPEVIALAVQQFQKRVQTATAQIPLVDRYIGERFDGNYPLSCKQAFPGIGTPTPAQLTILPDGSFSASGEFGRLTLLAGASQGWVRDAADTSVIRIGREADFLQPGSPIAAATLSPSAGLITGLPTFSLSDIVTLRVDFRADGSGDVAINQNRWQCTGFPVFEPRSHISPTRLRAWLPDGNYQCEYPDYSQRVNVTVSNGVLSLPDVSLPFLSPEVMQEIQETDSSVQLNEVTDHLHLGDVFTPIIRPYGRLTLVLAHESGPYELAVRRSLVTGQGFFSVMGGGGTYQHCIGSSEEALVTPITPPDGSGLTEFL